MALSEKTLNTGSFTNLKYVSDYKKRAKWLFEKWEQAISHRIRHNPTSLNVI